MTVLKHKVLLIVGRTNSGKSTLVKDLCEKRCLKNLISYTTRERRSESDNDHVFVTMKEYNEAKANGDIIAETEIAGNIYYATKQQLYESDVYIIDPYGVKVLKSMGLEDVELVIIYITAPEEVREERALQRGDLKSQFRVRTMSENNQFREFVKNEEYDYAISNVNFEKSAAVLRWIADVYGFWENKEYNYADLY